MTRDLDSGIAGLKRRASWAEIGIWLFIAASLVFVVSGIVAAATGLVSGSTLETVFSLGTVATFALFVACVVLISMWIHRAHANLFAGGYDGLEYTPGWSVGWFFVPLANLVKPYHAMVELWERSLASTDHSLLRAWWGCFLVGGVLENVGTRMVDKPGAMAFGLSLMATGTALRTVSAWLVLTIIRKVTEAQNGMVGIGSTFD